MQTAHESTFNILACFPDGLTGFELIDLLETEPEKRSATSRLSQFVHEGLATKQGRRLCPKTGKSSVVYVPTGRSFADRIVHPHGKRTAIALADQAELENLREWKANAIRLFPELGTAPEIIAARDAWAGALRSEGQETKARLVEGGDFDDCEHMRVILHVLNGTPQQP